MKYLMPQLYVDLNTAGDAQIEALYEKWEANGANARAGFLKMKDRLPPQFVKLWETRSLHDAEVLGINVSNPQGQVPVAVMNLRQGDEVWALVYDLLQLPTREVPVPSDVFEPNAARVTALYDEIDVLDEAAFRHEILLSMGEVVTFDFFQFGLFVYHTAGGLSGMASRAPATAG